MRLVTVHAHGGKELGLIISDWVVRLRPAAAQLRELGVLPLSPAECPNTMMGLIRSGGSGLDFARWVEDAVREWLNNHDARELGPLAGALSQSSAVNLATPLSEPPLVLGVIGNSANTLRRARLDRHLDFPIAFVRPATCLIGTGDPIHLPPAPGNLFVGAELAFIVGREISDSDDAAAADAVFGYTATNDVQSGVMEEESFPGIAGDDVRFADRFAGMHYGKWWPGYAPTGPVIATSDEIPDPYDLLTFLRIGGSTVDRGHTAAMLFGATQVLDSFSKLMTLEPGTLIHLGAMHRDAVGIMDASHVEPGTMVEVEIERIGVLKNPIFPCVVT